LDTHGFEARTATGSELFSLLTCPHRDNHTHIAKCLFFIRDEEYKNLGDNTALVCEIFSSGCENFAARQFLDPISSVLFLSSEEMKNNSATVLLGNGSLDYKLRSWPAIFILFQLTVTGSYSSTTFFNLHGIRKI